MIRTIFTATLAGTALALAAPALAAPGGHGGGGGMGAGAGANVNAGGMAGPSATAVGHANVNAGLSAPTTTTTTTTTNPAVGVSQGPAHASVNGIAHANSHSVLAAGSVPSTSLPGLNTGLTVNTSGGTALGTVSQVITGSDGSIRMVIVTSPTGQTYRLPASSLSISGGVVTTTQMP
jgi:hypothetical protein